MFRFFQVCAVLMLVIITSSCTQKKSAPIINRGSVVYGRNNHYNQSKYLKNTKHNVSSSNVSTVVVSSGDTVYSIATKNNIPLRDLINYNHLTPPYSLKIGDKINLPQAEYYQVLDGDTLFGISRKFQMNVNDLISMNNLTSPYSIKVGEKIRVKNSPSYVASSTSQVRGEISSGDLEVAPTKSKNHLVSRSPKEIKVADKNNHFSWPINGAVISKFGPKTGGLYNDGINIRAKNGDNVRVTEDGVVAYVGNELRGYGNLIIVKHSGGWISAYAHLEKSKVKRGDKVRKKQIIAYAGSTGNVKSPQLYFGLRKGREAVNPQVYLSR